VQQPSSPDDPQRLEGRGTPAHSTPSWRFRLARFIAGSNVVGLAFGALLTIAFELPSISLIGAALAALAWNEWRGRKLLLAADERAPRRLALNQLLLCLVLLAYCGQGLYETSSASNPVDEVLREQPELAELLGEDRATLDELNEWGRRTALALYVAVAVGSVIVQGLTTALYLSLRPAVARR